MKYYLYIMSTKDRFLHLGYCQDILKTIEFYNNLPTISKGQTKIMSLVFFADAPNKETAVHYFNEYSTGPKQKRIELIESLNPTWNELIPGVNIEL